MINKENIIIIIIIISVSSMSSLMLASRHQCGWLLHVINFITTKDTFSLGTLCRLGQDATNTMQPRC